MPRNFNTKVVFSSDLISKNAYFLKSFFILKSVENLTSVKMIRALIIWFLHSQTWNESINVHFCSWMSVFLESWIKYLWIMWRMRKTFFGQKAHFLRIIRGIFHFFSEKTQTENYRLHNKLWVLINTDQKSDPIFFL